MKPKYLQVEVAGRDRWMISYLDVLTILLIFFIAVAAQSLEQPKSIGSVKIAAPAPTIDILQPKPELHPLRTAIQQQLDHYGLDWHAEPRGLVISLPQAVLFAPGQAEINPAALPMIGQIAEVIEGIGNKISLAGYADPTPIHNRFFKSNWELAAARSLSLLDLFTTRYSIAESRFSIASYGSNDPRNPNDTPDGRASNRRVEILILDEPPVDETAGVPGPAAEAADSGLRP
jgi:chemotaxis protein MotB